MKFDRWLVNINVTGFNTTFGRRRVDRIPLYRQMVHYFLNYKITRGDAWNQSRHPSNVRSVGQTFGTDTRKDREASIGATFHLKIRTSWQTYRLQTWRLATGTISLHDCQQKTQQQLGEDNTLINLNKMQRKDEIWNENNNGKEWRNIWGKPALQRETCNKARTSRKVLSWEGENV
jgi:hypothetical protein